jgi:hypothetical protein
MSLGGLRLALQLSVHSVEADAFKRTNPFQCDLARGRVLRSLRLRAAA